MMKTGAVLELLKKIGERAKINPNSVADYVQSQIDVLTILEESERQELNNNTALDTLTSVIDDKNNGSVLGGMPSSVPLVLCNCAENSVSDKHYHGLDSNL